MFNKKHSAKLFSGYLWVVFIICINWCKTHFTFQKTPESESICLLLSGSFPPPGETSNRAPKVTNNIQTTIKQLAQKPKTRIKENYLFRIFVLIIDSKQ